MSNTMAMKAEVAIERKRASDVIQQKVIDDDNSYQTYEARLVLWKPVISLGIAPLELMVGDDVSIRGLFDSTAPSCFADFNVEIKSLVR